MRAPVRPIRGRWPRALEQIGPLGRFFRLDPLTIVEDDPEPSAFREAMSSIYIGGTIKITGANRHPETDQLLIDHVDLSRAHIVDIGASDGSTSLDLIERLPAFASYTIADLYLTLTIVHVGRHAFLFHGETCVLVAGRLLMAWPAESRAVALAYAPLIRRARREVGSGSSVLLLNPSVRRRMAEDPRVGYRVHDVFTMWEGPSPDVIKVANLLRRLYFDDDELRQALVAIRGSLPEGGHLMIVDNPRLADPRPRAGLWRRAGSRFEEVARLGEPEIGDLVAQVGAHEAGRDGPRAAS